MFVWRLTRKAHSDEPLNGEGARRYGGRWNHPGTAVVYTSESLSLSVLEYLVNLGLSDLPHDLVSIRFEIPTNLKQSSLTVDHLPRNWRTYPAVEELKDLGDDWFRRAQTPVLRVPSAVVPIESNYIINPTHPDSKRISISKREGFNPDTRLYLVKRATRKKAVTRKQ